jgi:hypothetical protein
MTVNLVEKFVENVKQLETKIQPIYDFLKKFRISEFKSIEREFKVNFFSLVKFVFLAKLRDRFESQTRD